MSTVQASRSRRREASSHVLSPCVGETLGRYTDEQQRTREILTCPGAQDSVLVIDRLALSKGDARLLAHLFAEEPPENAQLLASLYLAERPPPRCRALTAADVSTPAGGERGSKSQQIEGDGELADRAGRLYRLALGRSGSSTAEFRWRRYSPGAEHGEPVTLRDVVGALESYEPVRALTIDAIDAYREDPGVSVVALRAELGRLCSSPIVLNRGLREAVLAAVQRGLSMSEIALRCGRVKHDSRGNASGETSWLGRRIGVLAEAGASAPTPWVSSDVLALIARRGLDVAPCEVEL